MKNVDSTALKNLSKHFLECQDHSRGMPKELVELQNCLKQLSDYAEKFKRVSGSISKGENGVPEDCSPREISFSVKEDVACGREEVEIIVMPLPEPITVISTPEENDSDLDSNNSEIGIYFIDDVKPVNFINVIQRELLTLTELFPPVGSIVQEIRTEFDHFKACCSCLKKVSTLLPDILKELQELIKFIKKRRNERYTWPNDSEYLRKSIDNPSSKPFKKEEQVSEKSKFREETVGFVTVHTKTPQILREVGSSTLDERTTPGRSEYIRQCCIRLTKCPQLSVFRSETQNHLRFIEKLETVEKVNEAVAGRSDRDELFLTEFSTAQVFRILHPVPVLERAVQLEITGSVTHSELIACAGGIRFVTTEEVTSEELNSPLAFQTKEFLMTAKVTLGEACSEFRHMGKGEMEKELKTGVGDLKDLMIEAHKNQIELSKTLLEKGVLNAAVVQLTDPKMLYEEKRGIEKAKKSFSDGGGKLEKPTAEELQRLVDELKRRCSVKNRMIIALLNGLRSNVPKENWEELITCVIRESGAENLEEFFRKSPATTLEHNQVLRCQDRKACTRKEFGVEELLTERQVKRIFGKNAKPEKDKARISFSEVISKTSKCLHTVEAETKLGSALPPPTPLRAVRGLREMNSEGEKLLKDLESEVNSLTRPKSRHRIEQIRRERQGLGESTDISKMEPGSATINLTIKIGDEEARSQYQSAVSVIPSGTMLSEKKSEISLPFGLERIPCAQFIAGDAGTAKRRGTIASGSFTSLALKFRVPVTFGENDGAGGTPKSTPADTIESTTKPAQCKHTCINPVTKSPGSIIGKAMTETESDTSTLFPQITGHCEQNLTMQKLRSRLRFLEESLRSLTRTIDRMDVLTEKLSDDAYESSENFKDIANRYRLISNLLGS